jgi:hypothetical protein
MWLRAGMQLLCCGKAHPTLVNGVFYNVERVDSETVVVRMDSEYHCDREELAPKEGDSERTQAAKKRALEKADRLEGEIELSHDEASCSLRLSHALCYASVQGLTIRNKHILLLDMEHPHFSVRSLIVGLSRATAGSQVHAAKRDQEDRLMARTKHVPPPPKDGPALIEDD